MWRVVCHLPVGEIIVIAPADWANPATSVVTNPQIGTERVGRFRSSDPGKAGAAML
jgi:hypothetical protein